MLKHFIFDKLSDKKNRLKIALQVSKLGFSHSDALISYFLKKVQNLIPDENFFLS